MFDTVHIVVHNVQRYPWLIKTLLLHSEKEVTNAVGVVPDKVDGLPFNLRLMNFKRKGELLVDVKGKKLTSSHYNVAYRMPLGGRLGFAEFNFSIPKFLYGTNILQFVQHRTENLKLWDSVKCHDYEYNVRQSFDRLMKFIPLFFEKFFIVHDNPISLEDIELRRFDICFNQYFADRQAALEYLNYQKHVRKKNFKYTSRNRYSFETSVFFASRDYGLKIYHKGSEYAAKEEKREHKKANRLIGRPDYSGRKLQFDVDALQNHADRILRYEISFRHAFLSKLMWRHVFRSKSPAWADKLAKWKEYKRIYDFAFREREIDSRLRAFYYAVYMGNFGEIDKFFHAVTSDGLPDIEFRDKLIQHKTAYKYVNLVIGLNAAERRFFKWWKKQRDVQSIRLMLDVSEATKRLIAGDIRGLDFSHGGVERALPIDFHFTRSLVSKAFQIFNEFRDHFEINQRTPLSKTQQKVDRYNERVDIMNKHIEASGGFEKKKSKVRVNKLNQILLMLEHYPLDVLVEKGAICRMTKHRYEKKLKDLDFNFSTGSAKQIWNDRTFKEYHQSLVREGLEPYLKNEYFI